MSTEVRMINYHPDDETSPASLPLHYFSYPLSFDIQPFDIPKGAKRSKIKMAQEDGKQNKFIKIFKAPIRVLTKARDFYVQTMSDWAASGNYSSAGGYCVDNPFYNPPAKNSTQTEDLTELMKATSARNLSRRVQSEIIQRPRQKLPAASRRSLRWTRRSVSIGRIEEDRPCEFGKDETVETRHVERERSRKCIVSRRAD